MGLAPSNESKSFPCCRWVFDQIGKDKPGDASGDVLMIALPFAVVFDVVHFPIWLIGKGFAWIKKAP